MFINEIFVLIDTMMITLSAIFIGASCGIGFLYVKFREGIIFRIGASIIVVTSTAVFLVDYINNFFSEVAVIMAVSLILFLIACVSIYLNNTIIKPINKLIEDSNRLSEGDLTVFIEEKQKSSKENEKNELLLLGTSFQNLIDFLLPTVNNIEKMASNLSNSSQELASSSAEVNASSEEISAISQQMSKGAQDQSIQITESIKAATDLRNEFTVNVEDIDTTAKLIENISTQVNMLALNASIEAARAGDYGRGFAVVADNIRTLAEDSKDAVSKVQNSIENLRINLAKSINNINGSIQQVAFVAEETASGAEEASAATEEQSATMEELTASAQELANMSSSLEEVVKKFTIR